MEKQKHKVEITYLNSGDTKVTTLTTDDLAWSMNQYQRNRLPFTWEILDDKECSGEDCECSGDSHWSWCEKYKEK
tara:strand:- start:234 stop:458 length:225 start_codon:yes stop_codon:yes gene_type:complete